MGVLRGEMLQGFLVVTAVDVVAINLQDDLAGLKTRCRRLPACSVSTRDQRSKVTLWYNYSGTVYNTLGYYENMKHVYFFKLVLDSIPVSVHNLAPFVPPGNRKLLGTVP